MHYKRKYLLINKKFQLKFAFFVCTWIFALSMIYPIIIYNLFEYFLKVLSAANVVQAHLTVEKIRDVENQVLVLLGVLQLLFLGITFILSLFLSHRIAGPLFKLKRALLDVSKGDLDQRITFRKNDHFMDLQDAFNEMIQHLSVRRWK